VAVTTAAAKIEIENNGVFIPVIMGAVWLADKGLTAYDVYQDIQAIKSGEKTLEQVAQEKSLEYVTGILVGNLAKHGVKVGTDAVKQVADKMAKNADGAAIATKGGAGAAEGAVIKQVDPKNLIPTQNKSEMSSAQVKRLEKDMKTNGFDQNQPIDAIRNSRGKLEIQDGHHRTEAAKKAGIETVPVRIWGDK